MGLIKIEQLPVRKFTGEEIGNCFFVQSPYDPVYRVKMEDIFEWIKDKAFKEGLTIDLKDNKLIFTKTQ